MIRKRRILTNSQKAVTTSDTTNCLSGRSNPTPLNKIKPDHKKNFQSTVYR